MNSILKNDFFRFAALLIACFFITSCAGTVSVPQPLAAGGTPPAIQSAKPALNSKGTEPVKVPDPNPKIRLPQKGAPFFYGLTVNDPLAAFYQAVDSKQPEKALKILEELEKTSDDALMQYAAALLRVSTLIPLGPPEEVEKALRTLTPREKQIFGKDFESTALRGEFYLWQGKLKEARAEYEKVLAAIGAWRVPTSYMKIPSNNNELNYFGRAQLRAAIGLAGVLIQEEDYDSALAWAADAESRFVDILGLTEHFLYGKYTRATPDLYTSHGWSLLYLAAARVGYSKNAQASEALFQKAKEYFAVEGQMDPDATVNAIREYVLTKSGLLEKPTARMGILPELSEKEQAELLQQSVPPAERSDKEKTLSLPSLPESFLKQPRAGEESPFGFRITPEYEAAFQAYLKGDGDQALSLLDSAAPTQSEPAQAWSLSFLRAQILMMMGKAADAEAEIEKTAEWETQAFGTNLNARSLRGDARLWLGDADGASADYSQVLKALGDWKLPIYYVIPPAEVSQLALRSRAQLRAYAGIASAAAFKGDYANASKWARAAEELFEDLYRVIQHPVYQQYIALDPEMVYARGLNGGILGASNIGLKKEAQAGLAFFDAAKKYFEALNYPAGQVIVDTFKVRALFDAGLSDPAEAAADELVRTAIEKGFTDVVWQIEALRGEILLQDNRPDEAETAFRRAQAAVSEVSGSLGSDHSKRRFGAGKEDITYRLVERDIQKENWGDLFRDLEHARARAFVDMLARRQMKAGREEASVREIQELDKKIRHQRLLNRAPGKLNAAGIRNEKEWLDLRHQKIEALKARDPELAATLSIQMEELPEIQKYLKPGQVLAYALPARPEEKIRFLLIDSESARLETTELYPRQLQDTLVNFKLLDPKKDAATQLEIVEALTRDLHLKDWKPESLLFVVPSNDLYFVPWGALDIHYPVVVLPTGGWLKRSPSLLPSASAKAAAIVGDPETGGAFPKLQGAREEAEAVAGIYGTKPLLGNNATEKALREEIGTGTTVLHLATHGFFDDKNPLNSAVILTTGSEPFKLTAASIFENPLPAKLVVLSGCETGLGKAIAGDDFLSLARSFYLGGTLAVVYSLWPVPDLPTQFFMEAFHRSASSGDYGKAWMEARNLMKAQGYTPREYGAFILGGQNQGEVL